VLRRHGEKAPSWLPNPLSRSGQEVQATQEFLERDFLVSRCPDGGSSAVLLATRSAIP
jgi:hypothetical protein